MQKSQQLFAAAKQIIPGGVNSPVRAFNNVGGEPIFVQQGCGAYITDVDGNSYIDYVGSWGPLILGHCHPKVVAAVIQTLHSGMSFGAPTELEIQLAQKIIAAMPAIEKIRMVNSGTEATMTAIRLARGFTQKNKIIKFNGCYHGHNDGLLVKAGSGAMTGGFPSSKGIPASVTEHTLVANYNDLEHTERLFATYANDLAAVIVEPVAGNMGFVLPEEGFLSGLRELCDKYNALLIFDEVMTGFRVALGGAQEIYQIKPDLTTLGKIIGGGMPVGAIGGRADIMECLAPMGSVYQAGTLSGNPLAMAAGLATLTEIAKPGFYENLSQMTTLLVNSLKEAAATTQTPLIAQSLGGMFGYCFTDQPKIKNQDDVAASNEKLFNYFFHGMLQQGIYLAPSRFEAGFVSSAHQLSDLAKTKTAAEIVLSNAAF
jgi:glutamate-1-semialdehyde 2,1-aminomutase